MVDDFGEDKLLLNLVLPIDLCLYSFKFFLNRDKKVFSKYQFICSYVPPTRLTVEDFA